MGAHHGGQDSQDRRLLRGRQMPTTEGRTAKIGGYSEEDRCPPWRAGQPRSEAAQRKTDAHHGGQDSQDRRLLRGRRMPTMEGRTAKIGGCSEEDGCPPRRAGQPRSEAAQRKTGAHHGGQDSQDRRLLI
ncbi:hypothetical protein P7K49_012921 [Saguinus oedipus]|uniref:Uncharacterized protein n=1 Tax=Saguinus oedipus TaxID=9490 RepID=A0ABQ9VEF2_SAGOE|nr:hypothetical protein P7K49_012921 [Saguinus oedipus]